MRKITCLLLLLCLLPSLLCLPPCFGAKLQNLGLFWGYFQSELVEPLFQRTDLGADRSGCYIQVISALRETHVAGDGFEGASIGGTAIELVGIGWTSITEGRADDRP